MKLQKVIAMLAVLSVSISSTYAAYPEVQCSTDEVFAQNACTQCFDGGSISTGDSLGLLTDELLNETSGDIIVYTEEQEMPEMVNLSSQASWSQTPSAENFWEYTDAFNNLYSDDEKGYIVPADSKLVWLQSKLGYAYTLDTNSVPKGSNVGLLVYKLISHSMSADGDIAIEGDTHNECVLFAAGDTNPEPPREEPPELPETGAEHVLLLILALILGFAFLKIRQKA